MSEESLTAQEDQALSKEAEDPNVFFMERQRESRLANLIDSPLSRLGARPSI
jgi:hypothetical protein